MTLEDALVQRAGKIIRSEPLLPDLSLYRSTKVTSSDVFRSVRSIDSRPVCGELLIFLDQQFATHRSPAVPVRRKSER